MSNLLYWFINIISIIKFLKNNISEYKAYEPKQVYTNLVQSIILRLHSSRPNTEIEQIQ